ncbi:hydroxyisourate hydrolase [Pantoea ananatis]
MKWQMSAVAALLMGSVSAYAAQSDSMKNPLSVHVLNLESGTPTPGISVDLEHKEQDKWVKLSSGVTDKNGRISALFPEGKKLKQAITKSSLKQAIITRKFSTNPFFPEIPVIFHMESSEPHYHIPLLLSPYGYSTYRGN